MLVAVTVFQIAHVHAISTADSAPVRLLNEYTSTFAMNNARVQSPVAHCKASLPQLHCDFCYEQ